MRSKLIPTLILLLCCAQIEAQTQTPGSVSQTSGALAPPAGSTSAPMIPGEVIQFVGHGGTNPLGICVDEDQRLLFVCDLFSGTTHLYNIDDLSAGVVSTIPNPAGNVSTNGIAISGQHVYWVIPGASPNLWRSLKDGTNPEIVGNLVLPGGGIVGDICITSDQTMWAVDVTNDQYSSHLLTGAFSGSIIGHPAGSGAGNSIAYRSDCNLLLVPHNVPGATTVSAISTLDSSGVIRAETDISSLGGFVNGIAHVSSGSQGVPSVFLVDASLNRIYELESQPACPAPQLSGQHEFEICGPVGLNAINDTSLVMEMVHFDHYGTVRDVDVYIEMEHDFPADVTVNITSPSGTTVSLLSETQYSGTLWGLVFDSDGQGVQPDGPGSLDDFDGQEIQGNWILTIVDPYPGSDGTLSNWCVRIDEATKHLHRGVFSSIHAAGIQNQAISELIPIDDTVTVVDTFSAIDLDVAMDLIHGFLSDLSIRVASPLGTEVTLLGQGPAAAGEIHTTFDQQGIPFASENLPTGQHMAPQGPGTLSDFVGESIQGDWTLHVEDSVTSDDGVLQNWSLDLLQPVLLNTGGNPLEFSIEVQEDIVVADIEVELQLSHPSIDQIHVTLISPQGTTAILEGFGGYAGTSIDTVYDISGIAYDETLVSSGLRMQPAGLLEPFIGESMQGTWTLRVQDNLASSQGWLTDIGLIIHGDDAPCQAPTVTANSSSLVTDIPYPIAFFGSVGGSAADIIHWDFGDGTGSPDLNTVHLYAVPGSYDVRLTVENPCGTAFSQFTVIVCEAPVADFDLPGWIGIAPYCAEFQNLSSGTIDHLLWDFGNGATVQNNGNASFNYDTPGFFSVTLDAYGTCGTVATMTRTNEVKVLSMGDINADGSEDTSDPITLVLYLFGSGGSLPCPKTGDVNGDQMLNLGDVVHQLMFLFGGGPDSAPADNCGSCDI